MTNQQYTKIEALAREFAWIHGWTDKNGKKHKPMKGAGKRRRKPIKFRKARKVPERELIAQANRDAVLAALREKGPCRWPAIQEVLPQFSQSTVSNYLSQLRMRGLASSEKTVWWAVK